MKSVSNNRIRRTSQNGFSLLEVLIAVVILSTVSIMAMRAMSTALDQTAYLDQKLMASWVAENRLNELMLALHLDETPKLSQLSVEQGGRNWVTTMTLGKQTETITQVEVSVFVDKKEGDPVYRLQSFVPTYLLEASK